MDSKIENYHRLNISNDIGSTSKIKGKYKARKELWDSLLAVYENENEKGVKGRQQKKEAADHFTDLTKRTRYGLKLRRKSKSKLKKKTVQVEENGDIEHNTAHEKDKRRHKLKDLERHKKILNTTVPECSSKDQEKNVPSVIVLHKYKKEVFNKPTESYAEGLNPPGKPNHKPEKNRKKNKFEHKSDSQENILLNNKSPCNNIKSSFKLGDEDKPSLSNKDLLKNKMRKRQDKGVVSYKTCLEPKLRKKRKKLDREQILKEVINTLNTNKDVYDKIKINENQLIFMHPSHIAKALEHSEDNKINKREKVNSDSMCNKLIESISHDMNKKKECKKTSSNKLVLDNRGSSKRLRVLSSLRKIRKSIPVVLEENSDISLIKVLKNNKEPRKRRIKLSSDKKKRIQELTNIEKEPKETQKLNTVNNLTQSENYSKQNFSILRQNVCFGDNTVDTSIGQNDKLSTSLSDSIRFKAELNKLHFDLKNDSAVQKNKNSLDTEHKSRKNNRKEVKSLRKVIHNNVVNSGDQIKPAVSEDEKKLTLQLIKTDTNPENLRRLRKNVYSVSDRRMLMTNKEKISPTIQNDRLYVTKRMLFFTNKESSSTSKESLNIAIRRDTEISNNGSSNNILNVVIKQKKNSVSSTKSANSPKLDDIGSHYSSNYCDTKYLQKMSNENDLETICKDEVESTNKNKQLKEAECQTEENTLIVNKSNEGNENQVLAQTFQLGNSTIQDEFKKFLIYHLKNINPSFRENNATNNSHEMLNKKQIFQTGTEQLDDRSKFGDNDKNIFTENKNISTPENQTCKLRLSENVQKFDTSCTKNSCTSTKKPFYRVLSSDEYDLQNSKSDKKLDVRKGNTPDGNKFKSGVNKEIPKTNLRIIEDLCTTTESENLADKLKSIGLSDKRSFVKVINSNYRDENSINTKVVDRNKESLPFKSTKSPQKQKACPTKLLTVQMNDDLKTIINKRQQNQDFSTDVKNCPTENSQTGKVINSLPKIQMIRKKENYLLENSTNTADIHILNPTNLSVLENIITNNCEIATKDSLKQSKQHFFSLLSANEDTKLSDNKVAVEKPQNKFNLLKKSSCCLKRNFVVSEVGVQTDTSDFLPTVPYKNIRGLKIYDKPNFDSTKKLSNKETAILMKKPQLLNNKNKFEGTGHTDKVGIVPLQEKGSFVHIINKKSDTHMLLNTNETLIENEAQFCFPVNCSEPKGVKQICVRKGYGEEKQVIDKINAVYEFLQYLDTILKENSFLKHSRNTKDTCTIGHFNSTLRCLCDNCIEILNKIEVKESMNRNKILEVKKSLENSVSQNEKSHFRQIICEPKTENNQKENNLLNVHDVTQNKFENNRFVTSDLKVNNNDMNPFFVVVSPDEKSYKKTAGYNCEKETHTKSNQYVKVQQNKPGSDRSKTYKNGEALLNQKVNKCTAETEEELIKIKNINKLPKNDIIHNTIPLTWNKILDDQILQTHVCSQGKSGNCSQVKQSSEKPFKNEISVNNKIDPCSKWNPHDTSNPLFNYVKDFSSKSQLDSSDCGNSIGLTKQDHKSNKNLCCKFSNTLLKIIPGKSYGFSPKLTSSCYKNSNFCCLDTKNTYNADNSSKEIKHLQNNKNTLHVNCKNKLLPTTQSTKSDEFKLCKNCSNIKQKCCCSQSITKLWIHRMKSPFKSSFKKDDKIATIKFTQLQSDLSTVNVMKTCEIKPLETIPSENKILKEPKIEEKCNREIQHKCMSHPKSQLNIKNNSNPVSLAKENGDHNGKKCNIDSNIYFNKKYFEREESDSKERKESSLEESRSQRNVRDFKGFNANVPEEQKKKTSNSVEYLNVTDKCNEDYEKNVEDIGSDGWVPLNPTNGTNIENNEIYFNVDVKDVIVKNVEYVQIIPNNLSPVGKNK